jgi:uncharacterized membrane protein
MVLVLALHLASIWSDMPETMASHFSAGGRADAFMTKQGFFLVMALVGGGSVAAVFVAPALIGFLPARLVNLPNRDYWLADDGRRKEAIGRLAGLLGWVGAATTGLLVIATYLAVEANIHRASFDEKTFLIFLGIYFVLILAMLVQIMRAFEIPEQAGDSR